RAAARGIGHDHGDGMIGIALGGQCLPWRPGRTQHEAGKGKEGGENRLCRHRNFLSAAIPGRRGSLMEATEQDLAPSSQRRDGLYFNEELLMQQLVYEENGIRR